MKRLLILLILVIFPYHSNATDFNSTDQMYGWNGTTSSQFYQTWQDHLTQLSTDLGVTTITFIEGSKALLTTALAATTCRAETDTATGAATGDTIIANPNASLSAVTGYGAGEGMSVNWFASTNLVTFTVCNNSAASITPGAVTVVWQILSHD